MESNYNFRLIDGKFTSAEAAGILFKLISSEINYHVTENFSSWERFGKNVPHSEIKIKELKEIQLSLADYLDIAREKGLKLKVNGFIEITMVE